jgi:hypothetical protein
MDDGSRRTSGDMGRRSSESARKASGGSVKSTQGESVLVGSPPSTDILADLSKLQKEIDALRASAGAT